MTTHRVAVTGATGFIGQHLLAALLDRDTYRDPAITPTGDNSTASSAATDTSLPSTLADSPPHPVFQIQALVRQPSRQSAGDGQQLSWIQGDLNNDQALRQLVVGADTVIHNAGVVRGSSAQDFSRVNADGTERLALIAREAGVKRFILISSLAAREPQLSHYAASKAEAEARLQNIDNLAWCIIRPPAVYGPGDRELAPLFNSMRRGIGAHPAGRNSRFSVIHVHDLARLVRLLSWYSAAAADTPASASTRKNVEGQTYEPDDGNGGYTWDRLRQIAEQAFQRRVRMVPIPGLLLRTAAGINLGLSRILNNAPMLSPGKVRELTHHDWVCRPLPVDLPWQPRIDLLQGLQQLP